VRLSTSDVSVQRPLAGKLQAPADMCQRDASHTTLLQLEALDVAKDSCDELKETAPWTLADEEITVMKD